MKKALEIEVAFKITGSKIRAVTMQDHRDWAGFVMGRLEKK